MVVILRTKPQPFQSVQLVEPEFDEMSDAEFYALLKAGIELPMVYIEVNQENGK